MNKVWAYLKYISYAFTVSFAAAAMQDRSRISTAFIIIQNLLVNSELLLEWS